MEKNLKRLSKRGIAALIMIIPISWFLSMFIMSLITQSYLPFSLQFSIPNLFGLIILIGFVIYGVNLKDERTSLVSDKASRNGFYFVLYVIPLALVVLSLTGASLETGIALMVMWFGAVAVFSISAFYHYRK